jgi:CARDB
MRPPAALKRKELNTVVASTTLTFKVAIHNSGASTKKNTAVKLVIIPQRKNLTAEKTVTVSSLRSGQTATVKFDHLGAVEFGIKTSLMISVDGHDKTYPILFSLPG